MRRTLVQRQFWNAGQSWHTESIWQFRQENNTYKVRVRITRNAYNEQSHGIVEVWGKLEWSEIATLAHPLMKVCGKVKGPNGPMDAVSYVTRESEFFARKCDELFMQDEATLLDKAAFVLR